jgi:hypothetical protein
MRSAFLIAIALVPVCVSTLTAQDASFTASVDKNPVAMDDQFTLSFVLSNAGMNGGKNLKLPTLEKFRIMMGPSTSTNMQIINGAVSSSATYSYVLQPKEVGKFTIGAATIEAGGSTYSSRPVTIEVVKGSARPKQQAQQGASGDVEAQLAQNLFLRASVDKSKVRQGEQVNLVYKIYTRVPVQNYNMTKAPSMTGFWSEDADMPKQIQLTTETIDGKQYQVGVVKRSALFPTQSGTLEIGPMEITTVVTVRSRSFDPFDSFFNDPFGRQVEYVVKSEPVRVRVEPLPVGAPSSFKGAVGKFTMTSKVDRQSVKTNEPISLRVTISGSGNIKVLESPSVDVPADFEQYTPKVLDNINRRDARIAGSKTFEYVLIPRYPGRKVIKPVEFSYFDLQKNGYVTLRSPEIDLNVEQGAAGATPFVSSTREDVQLLSQDIRFIKINTPTFSRDGEFLHTSGTFVTLMLLPLMGLGGAFVYTRQRKSVMSDLVGYRNRQAMTIAKKGLKNAETVLRQVTKGKESSSEKKILFYSEVAKSMWKYLSHKLNIQQADISIEGAVNELARRAVPAESTTALKILLESCEMARFAPTSLSTAAMEKTYNEASTIIVDLERTLKS